MTGFGAITKSSPLSVAVVLKLGVLHGLALVMLWGCSNRHTSSGPGQNGTGSSTTGSGEYTSGVSTTGVSGTSMGVGGSSGGTSGDCDVGAKGCDELTPMTCTEDGTWAPARGPCAIACMSGECTECAAGSVLCRAGDVQVCHVRVF